jgi:anti-sigma regulatory factor (Ser/Thr protein kinase)
LGDDAEGEDRVVERTVLEWSPVAIRTGRAWAAPLLGASGLPRSRVDDALLVLSELLTSAVVHGPPAPVEVVIVRGDRFVEIAVSDAGWRDARTRADPDVRALGVRLVGLLADGWDIVYHPNGKTVRARFETGA